MQIAQVSTWQTQCGIAGYTEQLTSALNRQGVETEVVPIDRDHTEYLTRAELRDYFSDLAERVAAADLVHVQHEFSFFTGAYSLPASLANFRRLLTQLRRRRQPAVVTFHTDPYWYARINKIPMDQALYATGRLAWRVSMPALFGGGAGALAIAQSRSTRRNLINAGIPASAVEVVRQGVPATAAANATEDERSQARAWLGLPRDARVLGMFGFVSDYKGYDVALKALERLPEHYHLLVVGGRHPKTRIPSLDPVLDAVSDPALAGRVTYTGFVTPEEREACLLATDICVAPYHGFPSVSSSAAITWALASGRPVIASEIPAFRELCEEEDCLEMVAPGSAAELALAVEMLSADPARQQALIDGAGRFAQVNSWANAAERHVEIYARLTDSRSPRPVARTATDAVSAAAGPRSLPPAPVSFVRRPQFVRVELDGVEGFWLAHDEDPRDVVTAAVLEVGIPDDAQRQLIRHLVLPHLAGKRCLVVDLGAHVGTAALPLAALGARLLAVEASPRNVLLLRASALRNRFDKLEVVHAAISERGEPVRFLDAGPWGNVLERDTPLSDIYRSLEVPGATLDELLEERGWPEVTLVKVDIEGSEMAALRGMRALLSSDRAPAIVLERNEAALLAHGTSFAEVGEELIGHGYRLLGIDALEPGRLVPMTPAEDITNTVWDVLAVKPGAEPQSPWHITPYTKLDIAGRIAHQARHPAAAQRADAASLMTRSPGMRQLPALKRTRAALSADRDASVRAAISSRRNGAPANGRLSFNHGRQPTFAMATYANGHGGYGYSAEQLTLAASEQGADIVWTEVGVTDDGWFSPAMRTLEAPEQIHEREVLLIYCGAYDWPSLHAPITLGMTMWETTELPDTWIPACSGNEALIVPSEFCREVFGAKLDLPIEVVPLGVNPTHFPELERPERDEFTFLMVGTLSGRKGADIAVRAFEAEFAPHEPVKLLLKTMGGILELGGKRSAPRDPRIEVIDTNLSRHELLALYGQADCLVASSRGEASGLTPREAMSTGIPAIVTRWGGLLEIADPEYSFVLEVDGEEPAFGPIYPLRAAGGARMGRLATPSVDHLRVLMREAYEDPERTRAIGTAAARWIRSDWTYEICAERWLAAITKLVLMAKGGNGASL